MTVLFRKQHFQIKSPLMSSIHGDWSVYNIHFKQKAVGHGLTPVTTLNPCIYISFIIMVSEIENAFETSRNLVELLFSH